MLLADILLKITQLRKTLLEKTDYKLTLFSTRANTIRTVAQREIAVSGNVNNKNDLIKVINNQDVVFAALSGDLGTMAKNIVQVMESSPVRRLIFISSMGIYNEIPRSIGGGNLNENSLVTPPSFFKVK